MLDSPDPSKTQSTVGLVLSIIPRPVSRGLEVYGSGIARLKCFFCVQGTLFHDRMNPEELRKIHKGLVALEEEYLQLHPGAVVQRV